MATTAVVNPRRKRDRFGRFLKRIKHRVRAARRRNPSTSTAAVNPRRRRRRRRNPETTAIRKVYSGGGYRAKNPMDFNFAEIFQILPAAVLGNWIGRWAVKQVGPFEPVIGKPGTLQPSLSHAIALWLAGNFGSGIVGSILGDSNKAFIAKISCYGYGGDLFMRKRFMADSAFIQQNLSLEGEIGEIGQNEFIDAAGNKYVRTASGWQLAGFTEQTAIGEPETEVIELPADVTADELELYGIKVDPASLSGLESSELGRHRHHRRYLSGFADESPLAGLSSFGY